MTSSIIFPEDNNERQQQLYDEIAARLEAQVAQHAHQTRARLKALADQHHHLPGVQQLVASLIRQIETMRPAEGHWTSIKAAMQQATEETGVIDGQATPKETPEDEPAQTGDDPLDKEPPT